jgi:hypothetical protein
LLDELPLAGGILPALPPDLKARLFDVFDLHILWNKAAGQATIWAEITDATLKTLPAILNPGQDGPGQDHHDDIVVLAVAASMCISACQRPSSNEALVPAA